MSDLTRIKEKLAKLLRLGEDTSASPGEIQNALDAAATLMARHQLSRDDIDLNAADPVARVSLGRHFAFCKGATLTTWESVISRFCCEFIGPVQVYNAGKQPVRRNGIASCLFSPEELHEEVRYGNALAFYGADDDARCASELFEELRDAISTMALVRWGSWARGEGATYAYGFATGLQAANRTARENLLQADSATSALMIRADKHALAIVDKATGWLREKHNVRIASKARSRRVTIHSNAAYSEGRRDGSAYSVSRPGQRQRIA